MAVQELLIRLGIENGSFSKKLQGVKQELNLLDKELEATMSEFKNFGNTQEGMAKKSAILSEKLKLVESSLEQWQKELTETQAKAKKLETTMGEFKGKLQIVGTEIRKTENDLRKSRAEYTQIQSSIQKLSSIKKTFEEASASIEKNKATLERAKAGYNGLSANIDKNKRSIDEYTRKNKALDNEISVVCRALNMNEKEIKELSVQYAKTQANLTKVTKQYELASAKYGENSEKVQKLKAEVDRYNSVLTRQGQYLNRLPQDVSKLSREYGENAAKIAKLELANKNMAQTQDVLKRKMNEAENEIKQQKAALQGAQAELKKFGIEEKNIEKALAKTTAMLKKEESALKENKRVTKEQEERLKALKKEEVGLQQQLDKTQKAYQRTAKEITNIKTHMNEFTAVANKTRLALKQIPIDSAFAGLEAKAKSLTSLGNVLTSAGSQIKSLGQTLTYGLSMPVAGFGAVAAKTFLGFEQRMRKVNAVFGGSASNMGKQFNYLSDTARKFGRETEWTAQQVGEAYEYMAMAGWDVEQSTEAMEPMLNLASIGMIDLGRATDIVTDTMTPFSKHLKKVGDDVRKSGKEFNEAQYMVDIFSTTIANSNTSVDLMGETLKYAAGPMASYGVQMKDLAFAIGIFGNAGQKGSRAGTQLSTGLNRLVKPSKEAKAVMEKYGISVQKTSDGSIDLMKTMEHLRSKLGGLEATQKGAIMTSIFGQQAQRGWISILNASTDEWNAMKDAMENTEGATERMMEEIEKSGAYSFKIMKSAIEDFLIVVGDSLGPTMKDIAESVTDLANRFSNWVSKMKDTNPELLALIGKIGVMAVVIPPIIMLFGAFTQGLGNIFTNTGKTIKAFTDFSKETMKVANGVTVTDGKVGIFAKGLGNLIAKFGGLKLALAGGVVALGAVAVAIGENETALSWLQDKWGAFGVFIGGVCEHLNGWFTLVFGNAMHLMKGVAKTIGAIITGNWRDVDDIWRETWADMENTTAKAMSNITMESTKGIALIREMSSSELKNLEKTFESTYKSISNVTRDNYKDVAKEVVQISQDLNDDTLTILRGTSDTMTVLFDGIYEGMNNEQATKQFEENLKGMASSGKYSADSIQKDFKKAFDLITSNVSDGSTKVQGEVQKITRHIGRLAQDGVDNVARNIEGTIKSVDQATFDMMKNSGKTWGQLFNGVEYGSADMATKIVTNLKGMGTDTNKIINALNAEIKNGFDETGKAIDKTSEKAKESAKNTSEAFNTMFATIKDSSGKGINEVAKIFSEGLSTLDVETINKLKGTSSQWYTILDGTVTENGKLVDNFSQQILWNLGYVSQQSPEKLKGFKEGLLKALTDANIITNEQMQGVVNKVDAKSKEAVSKTEQTGEKIKDNVTPKGADVKVKEELDKINGAISEKTESITTASANAGSQAQKSFDEKVSQLGKDIVIDTDIINTQIITNQFTGAGTLAIQGFVNGWNANRGLISEAISLSIETVTVDMSSKFSELNVQFDGLIQKSALLQGAISSLKGDLASIGSVGMGELSSQLNGVKVALGEISKFAKSAKNDITGLSGAPVGTLRGELGGVEKQLNGIRNAAKSAIDGINILNRTSVSNTTMGLKLFDNSIKYANKSVKELTVSFEKFVRIKFDSVKTNLDNIKTKLDEAKTKCGNLKTSLSGLNDLTFTKLINRLNSVRNTLSSLISSANSARYAVEQIKGPTLFSSLTSLFRKPKPSGYGLLREGLEAKAPDLTKYKTSGGYYNPSSLAGKGAKARETVLQENQLKMLKEQNDLLKQILLAQMNLGGDINLSVNLDGRQVAKSTAKYMDREIQTLNRRKSRIGGL